MQVRLCVRIYTLTNVHRSSQLLVFEVAPTNSISQFVVDGNFLETTCAMERLRKGTKRHPLTILAEISKPQKSNAETPLANLVNHVISSASRSDRYTQSLARTT